MMGDPKRPKINKIRQGFQVVEVNQIRGRGNDNDDHRAMNMQAMRTTPG